MAHTTYPEQVDRRVGVIISAGAPVVLVLIFPIVLEQWPLFAPWWNALAALGFILLVVSAAGSRVLPIPALRVIWAAIPATFFLVQLLTFPGYIGPTHPPEPWTWMMAPFAVGMLILVMPLGAAIVLGLVYGVSVTASGVIFEGAVPDDILLGTPTTLGNTAFAVIFQGVRIWLARLHDAEQAARTAAEREVNARAESDSIARFSTMVHDEVLAVLNAARLFQGDPPDVLRNEARHAVAVLSGPPPGVHGDETCEDAAQHLRRRALDAWDRAVVETTVADPHGSLPRVAVDETGRALAEAVRNARIHSGADSVSVRVHLDRRGIEAVIADGGKGFAPGRSPEGRLGVTSSIVERMARAGGAATVDSAPGVGTEVTLTWMR